MQVYSISGHISDSRSYTFSARSLNNRIPLKNGNCSVYPISFGHRNIHQIAEFTPECTGNGLSEMSQGGEGVVGFELGESLNKYEKIKDVPIDDRRFFPIWNYNNPKGGHKFLIHNGIKTEDLPDNMPVNMFVPGEVGQTKEDVARNLKINPEYVDYVVQSRPSGSGPKALSKYNIIEPTSAHGIVKFPSAVTLGEMQEVPYQIFKLSEHNPSYVKFAKRSVNYFIYTPELARAAKPYSYDCFGNVPFDAEIISSNGMRALAEVLSNQMDTDEFGYFKPASIIAHDRPASTFMLHLANMSANGDKEVNGMKVHKVEHNPSFDYQGRTYNPFQMISVVGNEKDIEKLKKHPNYSVVAKAFYNGGLDSAFLSEREKEIAKSVVEPYIAPFRDYFGGYNITKVPIVGVKQNPRNFSLGSVSWNFNNEMSSSETPDAAKGLTGDYSSIETKPVANGVTISNLRFDERDVQFGRGDNGLSLPENTKGFTPFKYDGTNIEEVIEAKRKNAKWFTELMWDAGQKGQEELNKLFFHSGQIDKGHEIIGYLSPMKKGEILGLGLGRPDTQKGYPISTGSALHFFKREDVPKELKKKVKFFFGIGLMDKNHPHYKMLIEDYKNICELDGGIYKHNIAICRGFTPNRLNACAQFGDYTSLYEMFGITPIEAKAAGSPSILTASGGFRDYTIDGVNGFITKDVVMGRPEKYGLTYDSPVEELEKARIKHQIPQMSDNIKKMVELYVNDYDGYVEMCRKNIEENVDWHNNTKYNKGMSANKRYLNVIFESDRGWGSRFKGKMKSLVGSWGHLKDELESAAKSTASRPARFILGFTISLLALGSIIYLHILNRESKAKKTLNKAA